MKFLNAHSNNFLVSSFRSFSLFNPLTTSINLLPFLIAEAAREYPDASVYPVFKDHLQTYMNKAKDFYYFEIYRYM